MWVVFGGENGIDAANDRFVLKYDWDANVTYSRFLCETKARYQVEEEGREDAWKNDWSGVIPGKKNGKHIADDVGEWLWNHFIGDGGRNYDTVARAQVNSLLVTGFDFGAVVDRDNPQAVYSSEEISAGELAVFADELAQAKLNLSSNESNRRVGMAINFITALPFTFATGGGE